MGWEDLQRERREQQKAAAQAKFEVWGKFLSLAEFGWKSRTFLRVNRAASEVGEQRRLSGYRGGDYEQQILAIRVAADTFAEQILAAAGDQDADTISWVVAGLRCPRDPFCAGCHGCQTVTSPLRPSEAQR